MNLKANNTVTSRFEVIRYEKNGWNLVGQLYAIDDSAEVSCIADSALKMSFRGNFKMHSDDIDFLTDRVKPILTINDVDYPLGIYVITTETHNRNEAVQSCTLEGYSLLYLIQRDRLEAPLHLSAGTNYIVAIFSDVFGSYDGATAKADSTEYVLSTDREDWETGTSRLDIINQLLDEISFNSVWIDFSGTVRMTKYEQPSLSAIDHRYNQGEYSLIEDYYEITKDRFSKCNVFRVVCENPEQDEPMVAISVNDSADNPYSTVNIGRVLYTENVDNIPSAEALQKYADKLKYKSYETTETVVFRTAVMPEHETFDIIALELGEMVGIYAETEWTIPINSSGTMTHKAVRLIYA